MFKENEVATKTIYAGYCSCTEIDTLFSSDTIIILLSLYLVFSPHGFPLLFVLRLFSYLQRLSEVVWSLLCQASFSWLGRWISPPGVPRSQPKGLGGEQLPLAPSMASAWSPGRGRGNACSRPLVVLEVF